MPQPDMDPRNLAEWRSALEANPLWQRTLKAWRDRKDDLVQQIVKAYESYTTGGGVREAAAPRGV